MSNVPHLTESYTNAIHQPCTICRSNRSAMEVMNTPHCVFCQCSWVSGPEVELIKCI